MPHIKSIIAILFVCVLPAHLCGQGWSPPKQTQAATASSGHESLNWLTLNRATAQDFDPVAQAATERGPSSFQDPFLTTVSLQEDPIPTFESPQQRQLHDTGFATIDLLPNELPPEIPPDLPPRIGGRPPAMPVTVALDARWEPQTDGFGVQEVWGGVKVPTYPLFGGPPPVIGFNFGITDLDGLTIGELFDFSIGIDWIKPLSPRWTLLLGLKPGITTDFNNTSSDMVRIRANAFGIYAVSPMTQWIFGAVVTGRSDLPIIPAVGLIWWSDEQTKFDLTFPRPRIFHLLSRNSERERWLYLGSELGGGTWAVELPGGTEDKLTYRSYRLSIGLEFLPAGSKRPGGQPVVGESGYVEIGYSFARELEFEDASGTFEPDSVFYLGGGFRF